MEFIGNNMEILMEIIMEIIWKTNGGLGSVGGLRRVRFFKNDGTRLRRRPPAGQIFQKRHHEV